MVYIWSKEKCTSVFLYLIDNIHRDNFWNLVFLRFFKMRLFSFAMNCQYILFGGRSFLGKIRRVTFKNLWFSFARSRCKSYSRATAKNVIYARTINKYFIAFRPYLTSLKLPKRPRWVNICNRRKSTYIYSYKMFLFNSLS